jgi:DNA-binding IclR family transcriptional regulator
MDPPQGAVRLTSVIGGRNPAYRTAVGKALLSSRLVELPQVIDWFGPFPLEQKTPQTLTTPDALFAELAETRKRGYGVDDQENEVGINCVAIPIYLDASTSPAGAISVSAVSFRTPLRTLTEAIPAIRATIIERLGSSALR